jgi:hypothetical protein
MCSPREQRRPRRRRYILINRARCAQTRRSSDHQISRSEASPFNIRACQRRIARLTSGPARQDHRAGPRSRGAESSPWARPEPGRGRQRRQNISKPGKSYRAGRGSACLGSRAGEAPCRRRPGGERAGLPGRAAHSGRGAPVADRAVSKASRPVCCIALRGACGPYRGPTREGCGVADRSC